MKSFSSFFSALDIRGEFCKCKLCDLNNIFWWVETTLPRKQLIKGMKGLDTILLIKISLETKNTKVARKTKKKTESNHKRNS